VVLLNKLKICMISDCFPHKLNPFACTFVFDLAKALTDRNLSIIILTRRHSNEPAVEKMEDILVIRVGIPFFSFSFSAIPFYISKLIQVDNYFDLDLIHAHFAYPSGFSAVFSKRFISKPVVVTTHRADVVTSADDRISNVSRVLFPLIEFTLRRADAVLPVSKYIRRETLRWGASPIKTTVIYNSVDGDRFNPKNSKSFIRKKLGIKDEYIIFTLCHLIPRKGVEYLIRAASLVKERLPNTKFIIGGDGPLMKKLIQLSDQLAVSSHIMFVGRIPHKLLPFFYSCSDIFVLPSLNEGHPVVILEAMASGLPIVATSVEGVKESVINGYNGFLVPPRNPKALAKAILNILNRKPSYFGEKSRDRFERRFSQKIQVKKLIDVYKAVIC